VIYLKKSKTKLQGNFGQNRL